MDHPAILNFTVGDTIRVADATGHQRVEEVRVQSGIVVVRRLRWWEVLGWWLGSPIRWLRRRAL